MPSDQHTLQAEDAKRSAHTAGWGCQAISTSRRGCSCAPSWPEVRYACWKWAPAQTC